MSKLALAKHIGAMDALAFDKLNLAMPDLVAMAAEAFVSVLRGDEIMRDVKNILVICGRGNNGKDGLRIAQILSDDYDVTVVRPDIQDADSLSKYDLVIDALFGVGFRGAFDPELSAFMKEINSLSCRRVAVDIPSGAECDTAAVCSNCFCADLTITFEFLKPACVSYPAVEYCGRVICVSIGFDEEIRGVVNGDSFAPLYVDFVGVKPREKNTHKGSYGTLLAVCGSEFMTGAAFFAAMGALRSGVGLLYLAAPRSVLPVLQAKLNEPVFMPLDLFHEKLARTRFNAVLFGCGCGTNPQHKELLRYFLQNYCRRSPDEFIPLILDADGINLLAENIYLLKAMHNVILTPHPAEFARISGLTVAQIQADRINAAKEFAAEYGCVVVLKGAKTVIASPDGRVAVNSSGNPGMAKGGSGDILAGIVASLCAQRWDIFDAAVAAVYIHGAAGDLCAAELSEAGMLPSDILDKIPLFFRT